MILPLNELRDCVVIQGAEYPIYTDFRDWLSFEALIRDDGLPERLRAEIMLDWFVDELPPPTPAVFDALIEFFLCGEKPVKKASRPEKRILDIESDMNMIYSGFMQGYGINLAQVDYLHWWEFCALLGCMPEDTRIAKVMGYRAMDVSKLPKGERKRYAELQRLHALDRPQVDRSQSPQDRSREMIERARSIRKRTEGAVP